MSGSTRGSCAAAMPSTVSGASTGVPRLISPNAMGPSSKWRAEPPTKPTARPSSNSSPPGRRQRIDAAVQMHLYQSPRRPSEVVDPRNRLLTSVAAFVQVDGDAEEPDLVRNGAVIGVEADPGYARSDPASLECPGASSRTAAHDVSKSTTRHEQFSAAKRVGAYPDKVIAGNLSSGPCDRVIVAPVVYLDSHQEPHAVEPVHQCWRCAWFGVRPEGLAIVHAVQHVFDVAVGRQHQRGYAAARFEPLEILRCQRVQPSQPIRTGHRDHTTVGQVNHTFATGQQPLLAHRVTVVPGHTDIWPGFGHYCGHIASALPFMLFFPPQRQAAEFARRTLLPSTRKANEVAWSVSSVSTSRFAATATRVIPHLCHGTDATQPNSSLSRLTT